MWPPFSSTGSKVSCNRSCRPGGREPATHPVHDELASFSRACACDRVPASSGVKRGGEPRDAHRIADELRAPLAAANEPSPAQGATDMRFAHVVRNLPGLVAVRGGISAIFRQPAETGPLQDPPVVFLTAGQRPDLPDRSDEANARSRHTLSVVRSELALLSTNSNHRPIDDASHYIHLDAPDAGSRP